MRAQNEQLKKEIQLPDAEHGACADNDGPRTEMDIAKMDRLPARRPDLLLRAEIVLLKAKTQLPEMRFRLSQPGMLILKAEMQLPRLHPSGCELSKAEMQLPETGSQIAQPKIDFPEARLALAEPPIELLNFGSWD